MQTKRKYMPADPSQCFAYSYFKVNTEGSFPGCPIQTISNEQYLCLCVYRTHLKLNALFDKAKVNCASQ